MRTKARVKQTSKAGSNGFPRAFVVTPGKSGRSRSGLWNCVTGLTIQVSCQSSHGDGLCVSEVSWIACCKALQSAMRPGAGPALCTTCATPPLPDLFDIVLPTERILGAVTLLPAVAVIFPAGRRSRCHHRQAASAAAAVQPRFPVASSLRS